MHIDLNHNDEHIMQQSHSELEFVFLKVGTETMQGLRCELHVMCMPLLGPAHVHGDGMLGIKNMSKPTLRIDGKVLITVMKII